MTDQGGRVTRYEYDSLSRLKRTEHGNGTETIYAYDALSRLKELTNRKVGGEVITSHKYTLDLAGHRARIEEKDSTVDYGYDKLYRLVSEHRAGGLIYDAAYTCGAVGNRMTKSGTDGSFTYDYDDNDRLSSDGKYTYAWDDAGRMTGRSGAEGTTTYVYNDEDRLLEATGPEGTARFTYDASGIRIGRTVGTGSTTWLIDPNMPYAQVLEETGEGATKVYAYGNDLLNVDGPDGQRWFAYDGLGSTRALTDAEGTLTDSYDYEAFGSLARSTGTTGNEFLFTGEQWEPRVGMYYLRARYYEPVSGRFGARDPWAGDPLSPITLHKYLYANVNPIYFVDPSGQVSLVETMIASSIVSMLAQIAYGHYKNPADIFSFGDAIKKVLISGAIGALGGAAGFRVGLFLQGLTFGGKIAIGMAAGAASSFVTSMLTDFVNWAIYHKPITFKDAAGNLVIATFAGFIFGGILAGIEIPFTKNIPDKIKVVSFEPLMSNLKISTVIPISYVEISAYASVGGVFVVGLANIIASIIQDWFVENFKYS